MNPFELSYLQLLRGFPSVTRRFSMLNLVVHSKKQNKSVIGITKTHTQLIAWENFGWTQIPPCRLEIDLHWHCATLRTPLWIKSATFLRAKLRNRSSVGKHFQTTWATLNPCSDYRRNSWEFWDWNMYVFELDMTLRCLSSPVNYLFATWPTLKNSWHFQQRRRGDVVVLCVRIFL